MTSATLCYSIYTQIDLAQVDMEKRNERKSDSTLCWEPEKFSAVTIVDLLKTL